MLGRPVEHGGLHLAVLAVYAVAALLVALVLLRRRMLR
jgi:lipooligosaccharide transport system permease protein